MIGMCVCVCVLLIGLLVWVYTSNFLTEAMKRQMKKHMHASAGAHTLSL